MTTTVSSKGQVVLPAELRQRDGIKPGQEFEVERIDCVEYRLKRVKRRRLDAKRGVSIPAALLPTISGDQFDASFDAEDDVVMLRRLKRKPNWLEVWKQCPVPMDDLPARSRERPKRLKCNTAISPRLPAATS